MKLRQKCEYCGNTSGKLDDKGGCITCGAFLPVLNTEENWSSISGTVAPYNSYQWTDETGTTTITRQELMNLSYNEIRNIVRRSVGLDENA